MRWLLALRLLLLLAALACPLFMLRPLRVRRLRLTRQRPVLIVLPGLLRVRLLRLAAW